MQKSFEELVQEMHELQVQIRDLQCQKRDLNHAIVMHAVQQGWWDLLSVRRDRLPRR